jgi:nitrous oxidase accessory protein NosD
VRTSKAGLAVLAAAAAVLALASPAAATTRVVTPGHSIQKAINKSKPGDTVLVTEGRYAQSLQITTDDITLRGEEGAVLTQPSKVADTVCNSQFAEGPGKQTGVCVVGDVGAGPHGGPPQVTREVTHVRIAGFTIHNFGSVGITIFGGRKTLVKRNRLDENGGYGVFSNTSRGTRYIKNVAHNNHEAGFYVGDSPHANAVVHDNVSIGNGNGIFLRNAEGGNVSGNTVRSNCVGILVLGDAPGPSGNWTIADNTADRNNKPCAGSSDNPAASGMGIALFSANDTKVINNRVSGNVHRHKSFASGGIVVGKSGNTPPTHDLIQGNVLTDNAPFDIKWDKSGTVTFRSNECERSSPGGLCH